MRIQDAAAICHTSPRPMLQAAERVNELLRRLTSLRLQRQQIEEQEAAAREELRKLGVRL